MVDRRLYKATEAAQMLGVSRATVYVLMASGELESVKLGASRRISAEAIDDLIRRLKEAS